MTQFRPKAFGTALVAGGLLAGTPVLANELRIVMESRLGNLDPIMSAAHQTRDHGYLIYDTLFALDADQNIHPQMVEDYSVSDDGRVYTFTLREGLAWHDGTPVTSADVVASINRWGERDRMGIALLSITSEITTPDDATFVLELSEASDVVLDAFAKPSGVPLFIMPESVAATPFTEVITDYTGSGPFIFVTEEFEPGARALYVKNEAYVPRDEAPSWLAGGKVAKVERIERIEMSDPLTALNALNSGEVDYVQTIPFDLLPLVSQGSVTTERLDEYGYQLSYRMNHLHPPFNDKLARQAVLVAIGQEEVLQAQFGESENYAVCGAIFGCGLPYENDALIEMATEADPERAAELLAQSDYDGEPVVILHISDSPQLSTVAPVMAQKLREIGFTVELQAMDFMTMLSRRANDGPVADGGWSIFMTSWHTTEISDPLRNYMIVAEGPGSYAGWADEPRIGELINDFLLAPSEEARLEIATTIQEIVYEEGIYAPLGHNARITGMGAGVEGVLKAPANIFWNVSKDEG